VHTSALIELIIATEILVLWILRIRYLCVKSKIYVIRIFVLPLKSLSLSNLSGSSFN